MGGDTLTEPLLLASSEETDVDSLSASRTTGFNLPFDGLTKWARGVGDKTFG